MNTHKYVSFVWILKESYFVFVAQAGIFTVSGILDSFIYHGQKAIKKKMELGKFNWWVYLSNFKRMALQWQYIQVKIKYRLKFPLGLSSSNKRILPLDVVINEGRNANIISCATNATLPWFISFLTTLMLWMLRALWKVEGLSL